VKNVPVKILVHGWPDLEKSPAISRMMDIKDGKDPMTCLKYKFAVS